jgi:hypothetical protein
MSVSFPPSNENAPGQTLVVHAYSGYKGEETPRAFILDGVRIGVEEILARWYTERHSLFKVRGRDGHGYVLRYDPDALVWELVMREKQDK